MRIASPCVKSQTAVEEKVEEGCADCADDSSHEFSHSDIKILIDYSSNVHSTSFVPRQMNLLRLPIEVIVEILLCLDVSDAYAVQALNHFFRNLYKTSLVLQYALECTIAHVRDNPNCHLSIPQRLQILRERESAWSSLTPTSKRITALPAGPGKCVSNTRSLIIQPNHCTLFEYSKVSESALRKYFQISSIREIKEDSFHPIPLGIGNLMHVGFCVDEHDLIACLTK